MCAYFDVFFFRGSQCKLEPEQLRTGGECSRVWQLVKRPSDSNFFFSPGTVNQLQTAMEIQYRPDHPSLQIPNHDYMNVIVGLRLRK